MRGPRITAVALILSAVLLSTACATQTPLISDEERCTRFGGLWQLGACRVPGGSGSM